MNGLVATTPGGPGPLWKSDINYEASLLKNKRTHHTDTFSMSPVKDSYYKRSTFSFSFCSFFSSEDPLLTPKGENLCQAAQALGHCHSWGTSLLHVLAGAIQRAPASEACGQRGGLLWELSPIVRFRPPAAPLPHASLCDPMRLTPEFCCSLLPVSTTKVPLFILHRYHFIYADLGPYNERRIFHIV